MQLLLNCVRLQELHLQLVDTLDDLLWEQVDQRHCSILDKYFMKLKIGEQHNCCRLQRQTLFNIWLQRLLTSATASRLQFFSVSWRLQSLDSKLSLHLNGYLDIFVLQTSWRQRTSWRCWMCGRAGRLRSAIISFGLFSTKSRPFKISNICSLFWQLNTGL